MAAVRRRLHRAHEPHVNRAHPLSLGQHDQGIDFEIAQVSAMIEIEFRQPADGGDEANLIGGVRCSPVTGQSCQVAGGDAVTRALEQSQQGDRRGTSANRPKGCLDPCCGALL